MAGDLPDLSIRQLEYLVAVADEPTWARAATRVGVSPSALSQGLAELERRVGVSLFDRDGRRRLLRATAAPVVDHARQVLALTGDLTEWSQRMRHGFGGRVRLGMIDAAAVVHFPDALRSFRAGHPDVELRLRVGPSGDLLALLRDGELDLAVCVEPPASMPDLDLTPLLDETLAVYAPPDADEPADIADPARWGPWVLFPEGSHTRRVVVERLARLGAPIDTGGLVGQVGDAGMGGVVGESHQPEVLCEMVRLGIGWTVLPTAQAEAGDRPLSRGRELVARRLVLARRRGAIDDPVVDTLAAELRDLDRTGVELNGTGSNRAGRNRAARSGANPLRPVRA